MEFNRPEMTPEAIHRMLQEENLSPEHYKEAFELVREIYSNEPRYLMSDVLRELEEMQL